MENLTIKHTKRQLRQECLHKRKEIDMWRRQEAELLSLQTLTPYLRSSCYVLSYASFRDELSTVALNGWLVQQGKLVLPRMDGQMLTIHHVQDLSQLQHNGLGILEPDPKQCPEVSSEQLSVALVPGVAFDVHHHRLGYGQGYYDRFLSALPSTVQTLGLGFQEQLTSNLLPVFKTDVPLSTVFLF